MAFRTLLAFILLTNQAWAYLSPLSGNLVTALTGSGTEDCIPRWNQTGVYVLQDSVICVTDLGAITGALSLAVGNLDLSGNTIASSDANGNIILNPNGTGQVNLPDLTASLPLKLDASNNVTAAAIDLSGAEVTGVLPAANLTGMVGATGVANGIQGAVPAPLIADELKFLRGDGTWQDIVTTPDATDVTYTPTTSADWDGPPSDVQEALDEIADRVENFVVDLATGVSGLLPIANLADGAADQLLGTNAAGNANEWKTLSGTANRVTVTHGAGTITLSGPQDLGTADSPTFSNATLSGRTAGRFALFDTGGALADSSAFAWAGSVMTVAGQFNTDNLRLDGNVLSSTDANGNVQVDPNGTGILDVESGITADGNLNLTAASEMRLQDTSGGEYSGLKANGTTTETGVYTLPAADGNSGQVLRTDGSFGLSWVDNATTADTVKSTSATSPKICSFSVNGSTNAVSNEVGDCVNGTTCPDSTLGLFVCSFNSGYFTTAVNCVVTAGPTSTSSRANLRTVTTSAVTYAGYDTSNTLIDLGAHVICFGY